MDNNRVLGWALVVPGGVLILIAVIWGRAGFYASQAPILLILIAGGGALAFAGGRMLRKPRQDTTPVDWRPRDDEPRR